MDKKDFRQLKPETLRRRDFISFCVGFLGLVIIGVCITGSVFFFSSFYGLVPPAKVEAPFNAVGWIVIIFSCLGTGYLEESYFRYYLLTKLENSLPLRIAFSSFLFSICHIYEGPWGVLNAALAGVLLSLLFIRFRSLNGIAWAHGVYNIIVYAVA
jgi:membrane protease YdiL (CAAX protease family)